MKIIIIEDSKKLADSLKKGLENEGYAADCFYDGLSRENQFLFNFEDYDLVILDLMLPDKSGLDICRNLREKKTSLIFSKDFTGQQMQLPCSKREAD